ncbi:MAG: LUD domain-containing protein [Chloroflexi bacterium]|nr:LUD domain-containing protein [Chloroflexota bacterium]
MAENADLINKFTGEVSRLGTKVFLAETPADAVNYIVSLVRDRGIKTAVKANSEIAVKLELNENLAGCGVRVTETSIVQWTLQLLKGKDVPADEVAALISSAIGQKVGTEPSEMLKAARRALKEAYVNADLGITEADIAIAMTGSLITLENEGNARLAAALPRIHLTLLDASCVVADLAAAAEKIKGTSAGIPGHKVSTFITHLSARNTTGNMPGAFFARAQGPAEELILMVNFH